MSAFTSSIPNLLNGVSTQAATLRLVTQGEEQVNGYSTLTRGLLKRPPSQLVRNIGTVSDSSSAYVHMINRDAVERYLVFITNGDLRVYDLAGNAKTVNFPDGKTYLNSSDPKSGFAVTTIADFTFIANKNTVAAMSTLRSPKRNPEALVNVLAGNYTKDYKVIVNGATAAHYRTGSGIIAAASPGQGDFESQRVDGRNIATTRIAQALLFGASTSGTLGGHTVTNGEGEIDNGYSDVFEILAENLTSTDWILVRYDSAVHVQRKDTTDFTITGEDGFNGNAMKVIKTSIQNFGSLPVKAPDGFHIEITGENSNNFDNYYVKFVQNQNTNNGAGVWKETVAQDIPYRLDAATMPHILLRESDGTFTFKRATWTDRLVGDEDRAPTPSFVGQKINDVFLHRNRLGFVAGENVILSASGDFFNFFRRTLTTVLDTDPIDVGPSFPKVSILRHANSYNGDLLCFAENVQFRITGGDLLTPKSAAMRVLGEYAVDVGCKPVSSGAFLHWVGKDNNRSVVRELWLDETGTIQPPLEANSHCPDYIPTGMFKMASSTDLNMVVGVSSTNQTRLYVYKYYWSGREKPQSSWSYWDFGATILSCDFIETDLWLVLLSGTDVRIVKVPCQVDNVDTGMTFQIYLDQRVELSGGTYDATNDRTSYTLPYVVPSNIEAWTGYSATGEYKPGHKLLINSFTSTTLRLVGDTRNEKVYAGIPYTFQYRFSPFHVRRDEGGAPIVVTEGRTQILRTRLTFAETGFFKVEVTPENRSKFTYDSSVNAWALDDPMFKTEDLVLEDGDYSFPVKCENTRVAIDIINDSAVPSGIISADWVALWYPKTRRV
jgi:hypothetical protein